jgi:hypothetical protein
MNTKEEMLAEMKGKTVLAVEVRRFIAKILMTEKIKDDQQTSHYVKFINPKRTEA